MGLCIIDLLVTGLYVPNPPRSDNLHIRSKCLDTQFKPNLIVALTSAAMADSIGALGLSDFHQTLCNQRPKLVPKRYFFS